MAAGPGGGKSAIMHALLHHGANGSRPETLYFSADTGPNVIWKRAAAMVTKKDQSEIERLADKGALEHVEQQLLSTSGHINWDFYPTPTPDHVTMQINAYVELHDRFPDAIVVDNLKDLADPNDGDEFRALEDACVWLKNLAMQTGIAVITLHHVGGFHEDGVYPIPLSGLRGKIGKTPALILTLHRPEPGEVRVSVVKHRDGVADSSGLLFSRVKVDLGAMSFVG